MIDQSKITVAILSAGLGTRLRPLTETIPKVMVPFDDVPLLEHTILLLKGQGFRKFVVNLHYLPEIITEHFGDGKKLGVEIRYSDETDQLLETAGAIKKMEPLLSDPFLLLYGDHVHFYDFQPLLNFHTSHKALATLALKRSDNPQNGEIAEVDPVSNRILVWHTRPHDIKEYSDAYYINSGLYVLSKEILNDIPINQPIKLDGEVLPLLIKTRQDIYGLPTDEHILDIGTLEKYQFAKEWYREKKSE